MSSSGKLRLPKGARTCTRAKSCCANHDGGWYKDTNGWSKKYVKYMLNQHSKAIVYLCPPIFFVHVHIICFRFSFMCQLLSYTNSVNIFYCSSAWTPMANHLDSLHGIFGGRCGFHISNVRFALIWGWAFQALLSPTSPAKSQASHIF